VKNLVVGIHSAPDYEILTNLTSVLNAKLAGLTVQDIDRSMIDALLLEFGKNAHVLMPVLEAVAGMLNSDDDVRVSMSGVKNILGFPEFADIRKAEAIFQALEDKDFLSSLLGRVPFEGIRILIGEENTLELLRQSSLIKASYSIDNTAAGCIALIGPMRMNYVQAVSVLAGILQNMEQVFTL
jgi:heat-inducible transcriptional repressor